MRRFLRWFGWTLLGLVLLGIVVAGGGYWWLRQSLPKIEGEIEVAGLEAPVTIVRDRFAIPHIEAASPRDATFGLGFAHAQDRLWQMEFQRRLGAGRLAEIVGEAAVPTDRLMRTLGLYRRSEASLAHLAPETIAWLQAYADGVNAFLDSRTGPLPPEFLILRHTEVEPWRPADSLVWLRLMALDLATNSRDEIARAQLARRLSPEQIADMWPDYPDDAPVTLTALARTLPFDPLAAALPPAPPVMPGSNAWVLAGSRTATGAPLLANDPHLELRAPGVFYLAHLKAPDVELVGATLPGVPGVVLGHNGHVAWGFTNTGFDTQDLFIERLDPDDPGRYLTPDGLAPFVSREEVIEVKDAPSETFEIRETRHGPVVSDLMADPGETFGQGHVAALAWTALAEDDVSIQALLEFSRASDGEDFVAALRQVASPVQNILYADTSGRIGFYAPGRVPIRKKGDGRWPVPGWTGEYDWQSYIPFEGMPHAVDPPAGVIINANNRVVPPDYPYLLTADWEAPYRARRLAQLLGGRDYDLAMFAMIQEDQLSLLAEDLLPIMLRAEPASPAAARAMEELRAWDRVMRSDARAPLLFAAWYRELSRLIYADELGTLFRSFWSLRPRFIDRILKHRPVWCDDLGTERVETCAELAGQALELALADLERRLGNDQDGWRWGRLHAARMTHAILKEQPLLARLFNIEIAVGGDGTTVDAAHYRLSDDAMPFASIAAASYRAIYDLADLDRSRFVAATGQSGNPLSRHYHDLTELWATGQAVAIDRVGQNYRQDAIGVLRLRPRPNRVTTSRRDAAFGRILWYFASADGRPGEFALSAIKSLQQPVDKQFISPLSCSHVCSGGNLPCMEVGAPDLGPFRRRFNGLSQKGTLLCCTKAAGVCRVRADGSALSVHFSLAQRFQVSLFYRS